MEITYKDYKIRLDPSGYTLMKPVPQKKDPTKITSGEIGYYTSISYMIEVMIRNMIKSQGKDLTLQEYIKALKEHSKELKQLIDE